MLELFDLLPQEAFRPLAILLTALVLLRLVPIVLRGLLRLIDDLFASIDFVPSEVTDVVSLLVSPLRFIIVVIGIWLALASLPQTVDLNNLFLSLVVVIFFWMVTRVVEAIFDLFGQRAKTHEDTAFNETLTQFGSRLSRAIIALIGLSIVMQFWGYDLSALVTGLGIGGLAVALAAQEALSNLIGYFAIITDRPFEVGDYVMGADFEGVVEAIGFRTTRLRRSDRAVIFVPNNLMTNQIVTNWTLSNTGVRRGRFRIHELIRLNRQSSAEQIAAFIQDIRAHLNEHPRVVPESAVVNFDDFGEGYLEINLVVVVNMTGWADLQDQKQAINLFVVQALGAHNLELFEVK